MEEKTKKRLEYIQKLIDDGKNTIIINGNVGVGKTFLAKKLYHDYFIDEPTYKLHLSSGNLQLRSSSDWNANINLYPLECLTKKRVVIYDDFGSAGITEAYIEKTLYWLNNRIDKWYITIFTTNLSKENWDKYEPRITSRISQNAVFIELQWEDLRKKETIYKKI